MKFPTSTLGWQSGFAHSPRLRSPGDTDATHVDAQARGGGSALKIKVCERHWHRVTRGARARGFYFPTDGFVQLRAARAQNNNQYYLFNFLWGKVGPAQTYVDLHTVCESLPLRRQDSGCRLRSQCVCGSGDESPGTPGLES